jgi:hypothetical protein
MVEAGQVGDRMIRTKRAKMDEISKAGRSTGSLTCG